VIVVKDNTEVVTLVKDLKKNDQVKVSGGETSTLECLAKVNVDHEVPLTVLDNGLRITPNHPVFVGDKWDLPKNISKEVDFEASGTVYCFVLNPPRTAIVNGIECASWGNELPDADVHHPYYGS
jgi:hypothetical protein